jgi:hypothetical protein
MNLLVNTTWDPETPFDRARSHVTCTLPRVRGPRSMTQNAELMLRVDRVLEAGPLAMDPTELRSLLDRVRMALTTAHAAAECPTSGQMETAYWTYQAARLQQCRRLLQTRVGIRL